MSYEFVYSTMNNMGNSLWMHMSRTSSGASGSSGNNSLTIQEQEKGRQYLDSNDQQLSLHQCNSKGLNLNRLCSLGWWC